MTTLAENIECLSAWAQTQEQVQRASWQVQVAGLMHVEQEETLTTEYQKKRHLRLHHSLTILFVIPLAR